jgi:hypothetical protein
MGTLIGFTRHPDLHLVSLHRLGDFPKNGGRRAGTLVIARTIACGHDRSVLCALE